MVEEYVVLERGLHLNVSDHVFQLNWLFCRLIIQLEGLTVAAAGSGAGPLPLFISWLNVSAVGQYHSFWLKIGQTVLSLNWLWVDNCGTFSIRADLLSRKFTWVSGCRVALSGRATVVWVAHRYGLLEQLLSDVAEVCSGQWVRTNPAHGLQTSDSLNLL